MNNNFDIDTHRHILISTDFDMNFLELSEFVEQHLGYTAKARSFHIPWVGEIRILKDYAGESFCQTVEIDFTDYIVAIHEKHHNIDDEDLDEALDHLMECLIEQMIEGSPIRKDGSRLFDGRAELATMLMQPEYDVVPAPVPDTIAEFKANAVTANNVDLYEMFLETIEQVRNEERAIADARVEAVEKEANARIESLNSTLGNVISILTKEADALKSKNSHLSELAGIPKFRRTSDTRSVNRKSARGANVSGRNKR